MSQMTNEQKEQYENWESVELPYKIVGEYYPNLKNYNEEVDIVVKIVDILSKWYYDKLSFFRSCTG